MNNNVRKFSIKCLTLCLLFCLGIKMTQAQSEDIKLKDKIFETFEGIKLKGGVKIDESEQIVTLNLVNSDLRQVLRMLANKAKLNIIMHDSLEGTVTLDLVEVPVNKVFEYIMTINNLTYRIDDNTLIVAPSETATSLDLNIAELKPLKVKYIDAQKAADFLNSNIYSLNKPDISSSTIATANPSTNEVLIFGNDNDVEIAKKVIKYIDIPPTVTNLTVNYADPLQIASKICWTVFKSGEGEQNSQNEADLSEGSEISLVCGSTAGEASGGSGDFSSLETPSYWILADTGLNQITIYGGTQEQINMAENIVKSFDKKEPQVYMEISILELSETGTKTLNSVLNLAKGTETLNFSDGALTFTGDDLVPDTSLFKAIFNDVDAGDINTITERTIKYIIDTQQGREIANPRIIAANNTQSEINISSDIIESTQLETDAETDLQVRTLNISSDAGIELTILPKISPNGYVTLTVEPTFNTIAQRLLDGEEVTATLLNRRQFKAKNLRVKDGESLVIGGLIQETETNSQNKFPILGDLPVIGFLFKDQNTIKQRTELVLMITPRIIYDEDQLGAL